MKIIVIELIMLVLILISLINCSENKEGSNCNAIWVQSKFIKGYDPSTLEDLQPGELEDFALNMKKYNFKYIYIFSGPFQSDGTLPRYGFREYARRNIEKIRSVHPDIVVLPWIGGVEGITVYLKDPDWVESALTSIDLLLNDLKLDGVHLDFEYLLHRQLESQIGSERSMLLHEYPRFINDFHRKLRSRMPNIFISGVVLNTSPHANSWKLKTPLEYIDTLLDYVDQMSFLFYDTSIRDSSIFEEAAIDLMKDILWLKTRHIDTEYLIAIGTFENEPPLNIYRDTTIESISNTLNVLKNSEFEMDSRGWIIDGISIYCDWETSESEYDEIFTNWSLYRTSK